MVDAEKLISSTRPDDDDLNHTVSAITEDAAGFMNLKQSIDAVGTADGLVNENDGDVIVSNITNGSISILQYDE